MRRALLIAISAFAAGLVAFAGAVAYSPSMEPTTPDRNKRDNPTDANLTETGTRHNGEDELALIAARPLFEPTRRPFVAPPIEPVAVAEVQVDEEIATPRPHVAVRLLGILGKDGERRALVQLGDDRRPVWLKSGGHFEGMIVTAIEPDLIRLRCSDEGSACPAVIKLHGGKHDAGD